MWKTYNIRNSGFHWESVSFDCFGFRKYKRLKILVYIFKKFVVKKCCFSSWICERWQWKLNRYKGQRISLKCEWRYLVGWKSLPLKTSPSSFVTRSCYHSDFLCIERYHTQFFKGLYSRIKRWDNVIKLCLEPQKRIEVFCSLIFWQEPIFY